MTQINFRGESHIREALGVTPKLGARVLIDPTAVVMGDVWLGDDASVWPHVAMRGDVQIIRIGARTNIQDGTVLHVTHHYRRRVNQHSCAEAGRYPECLTDMCFASEINLGHTGSPAPI